MIAESGGVVHRPQQEERGNHGDDYEHQGSCSKKSL
jgi:hypothetical protein